MWCANCQDDVATEIAADGQSLQCTVCAEPVQRLFAPSLHPETQSARELLEKWAHEQRELLGKSEPPVPANSSEEPPEAIVPPPDSSTPPHHETHAEAEPAKDIADSPDHLQAPEAATTNTESGQEGLPPPIETGSDSPTRKTLDSSGEDAPRKPVRYRVDAAHEDLPSPPEPQRPPAPPVREHLQMDAQPVTAPPPNPQPPTEKSYVGHTIHEQIAAPHFDVDSASKAARTRPGRAESFWGQLLAYAGVGILTVGTVLVLWGYFGMIEQYASTGWLLSTAGQMLLLLGIVTLVSGGMQQTTHEVSERIEYLGGRMIRIEQSTEQILNGPYFMSRNRSGSEQPDPQQQNPAA